MITSGIKKLGNVFSTGGKHLIIVGTIYGVAGIISSIYSYNTFHKQYLIEAFNKIDRN